MRRFACKLLCHPVKWARRKKLHTKIKHFKLNKFCFICCEISCTTDLELHVKFVRAYDSKQHKYSRLQTTGTWQTSADLQGSHVSLHHLSTCPAICNDDLHFGQQLAMLVFDLNEWVFFTYVSAKMTPIIITNVLCSFKYYHDFMDISHILCTWGCCNCLAELAVIAQPRVTLIFHTNLHN